METKSYQITKMDGNNYFLWKIKIEMLLHKEKLWQVIEDDAPDPITPEWRNKDQSARASIGLTLEDHILVTMANCRTARNMWDLLRNNYEHKGLASRLYLLKKLYSSNFESYNNMETYLNDIQEVIERLRAIGEEIKEHHLIAIILCGLPSTYNPLITALENKDGDELKIGYVMERLRDEASRRTNQEMNTLMDTNHAMAIGNKRQITCHECNKTGHIRRNCPLLKSKNKNYSEERNYNSYYAREEENQQAKEQNQEWVLNAVIAEKNHKDKWLIDSGASCHMTPLRSDIENYRNYNKSIKVRVANGEELLATGEGEMHLNIISTSGENRNIHLKRVLFVPELSVPALCDDQYIVRFQMSHCEIEQAGVQCGTGYRSGKSYLLSGVCQREEPELANACIHLWHNRLGHRSITSLRDLAKQDRVKDMKISPCVHGDFCKYCQMGAMRQTTFKKSSNQNNKPFGTLVSDLCGPITPGTIGGNKYILTITDEATNFTHIKLLKHKSDAGEQIQDFVNQGKNKFNYYPEIFRSDEGGEFTGNSLETFFKSKGIVHQTSVPYTPQQNGRAERKNLTLFNMTRSMLKSSGLPKGLWGEAVYAATYILNRLLHSEQEKTPYELWNNRIPSVNHIRNYGSAAYALVSSKLRKKLDDTARECYLVGYGIGKKCYRLWMPGSNTIINAVSVSFDESKTYRKNCSNDLVTMDSSLGMEGNNSDLEDEIKPEITQPLRRSQRSNFGIPANKWTY